MGMQRRNIETAVGLFVLLGIGCLAWLSVKRGKLDIVGGDYVPVHAEFASVSGLKKGVSVEIAGVEIGKVESITLNNDTAEGPVRRSRKGRRRPHGGIIMPGHS